METTFLVVDDSKVVRTVARRMLESHGFVVEEAEDGAKALEFTQTKGMPMAVLLDVNMPVMGGLEFLEKLRSTPEGKEPIVIFCTTENDFNFIAKAMAMGAQEFIMKPFDEEIIRTKLSQLGLISG